jgi:hypothetical protein
VNVFFSQSGLGYGQIRLRLHQIELGVGQLHFLPRDVNLGHASHLEECVDLVQVLALVLHSCLPDLDQFLRRKHAEVPVAHVQQRFLTDAVAVLLGLRQFRFAALDRAARQAEVVDVLAETQAGVVIRRVRPGFAVILRAERAGRGSGQPGVVVGLLIVRCSKSEMGKVGRTALLEMRFGDVHLGFRGREVGLILRREAIAIGQGEGLILGPERGRRDH